MTTYDRGSGGITLTLQQVAQLSTLLSQVQDDYEDDPAQIGLVAPLYNLLRSFITETDAAGNEVPKPGVDASVWRWIDGARLVNAGDGFFADFIREYTKSQYSLREGDVGDAEFRNQKASNEIGINVILDILDNGGALPGIEGLGVQDAGAAASTVYVGSYTPNGDYAGWAGTLLFPFLGHYDFFNDWLLSADTFSGTLPDGTSKTFKNVAGTYDLIAAIQAGREASIATGTENPYEAIMNLNGPEDVIDDDQSDLMAAADLFFAQYYGLSVGNPYTPGDELIFSNLWSLLGPNYMVGTLYSDSNLRGTGGTDVVNAGPGSDTIVGSNGSDLLDGGRDADHDALIYWLSGSPPDQLNGAVWNNFTVSFDEAGVDGYRTIIRKEQEFYGVEATDLAYNMSEIILTTAPELLAGEDEVSVRIIPSADGDILRIMGADESLKGFPDVSVDAGSHAGSSDTLDLTGYRGAGGAGIKLEGSTIEGTGIGFSNFEVLIATALDDVIQNASGFTEIYLGDGADIFYGGSGNETVVGGTGNDTLEGGAGADAFIIGGGDKILDPEVGDRIGFGAASEPIWLHGGVSTGNAEDTGDGREEYGRSGGEYVEETDAGTVKYNWTEGSDDLQIELPDGSEIGVEDWENGEAGITLKEAPDDDKYDDAGELASPLVLDLDGDGIELTDPWRSWTYFDIDEDGFAERTGWVSPDDGLLALDVNTNGSIDDISELFGAGGFATYDELGKAIGGDPLPSGFDELRTYDDNSDGVIDNQDNVFADLLVWRDLNGDGISQAGELQSLASLGIASINLTTTQDFVENGENYMVDFGSYTKTDSTTAEIVDVWFAFDAQATQYRGTVTIDPATEGLPKMRGYGETKDLDAAMSEDAQLLSMVSDFADLTVADAASLEARAEAILLRWHGADAVDAKSRGNHIDGQWLTALEGMYGLPWSNGSVSNPNPNAGGLLAEAWRDYKTTMMVRLLAQTPLGQVLFPGLAYVGMAAAPGGWSSAVSWVPPPWASASRSLRPPPLGMGSFRHPYPGARTGRYGRSRTTADGSLAMREGHS